jgi:hypothetical protein
VEEGTVRMEGRREEDEVDERRGKEEEEKGRGGRKE